MPTKIDIYNNILSSTRVKTHNKISPKSVYFSSCGLTVIINKMSASNLDVQYGLSKRLYDVANGIVHFNGYRGLFDETN